MPSDQPWPGPQPATAKLPTLIGYWDLDLRNVSANDAYIAYFGMMPAQVRGRHLRELLGAAAFAQAYPHIEAAQNGVEPLSPPAPVQRHGTDRYTEESYVPNIVDGLVQGFYQQIADVTARVETEHARDETLRLHEISMKNAPIGKTVLDTSGFVLQVNPALCTLLGYAADELIGTDFRRYVDPADLASGEADLAALLGGATNQVASERRYVRRDGTVLWMQRNGVLVPGVRGTPDVVIAQFQDVSARRRAETELTRLATTDPLTGLRNRHALIDYVEGLCAERPAAPLGVIFIDLDDLKRINDAHGHAFGDAALVRFSTLLAELIVPPRTLYRLGGDEFVILDPDSPESSDTAEFAQLIRLALNGIHSTATTPTVLAASVGWTWGSTENLDELLHKADTDMYLQKTQRRRTQTDWNTDISTDAPRSSAAVGADATPD